MTQRFVQEGWHRFVAHARRAPRFVARNVVVPVDGTIATQLGRFTLRISARILSLVGIVHKSVHL